VPALSYDPGLAPRSDFSTGVENRPRPRTTGTIGDTGTVTLALTPVPGLADENT